MTLISREILNNFYDNSVIEKGETYVEGIIHPQRFYSYMGQKTIFLSHSHHDESIVERAVFLLRSLNVSVYVDWMDDAMPPITNGMTAKKIKDKIITSTKVILLATNNGINSKWCNWELGFADAHKYIQHVAILPVTENDGAWKGNEYLQIYPYIDLEVQQQLHETTIVVYIKFLDGSKMSFSEWLNW